MKATIATLLMILFVSPQFLNASPMPASNEVECEFDPDLCDSSKPSNPPRSTSNNSCQCSGHLSETHTGLKIGECNSKKESQNEGEGRFFCYIEATNSKCCEAESSRYTKYCLNYSICEDQEQACNRVPNSSNQMRAQQRF